MPECQTQNGAWGGLQLVTSSTCLQDPSDRWTASQLLEHPLLERHAPCPEELAAVVRAQQPAVPAAGLEPELATPAAAPGPADCAPLPSAGAAASATKAHNSAAAAAGPQAAAEKVLSSAAAVGLRGAAATWAVHRAAPEAACFAVKQTRPSSLTGRAPPGHRSMPLPGRQPGTAEPLGRLLDYGADNLPPRQAPASLAARQCPQTGSAKHAGAALTAQSPPTQAQQIPAQPEAQQELVASPTARRSVQLRSSPEGMAGVAGAAGARSACRQAQSAALQPFVDAGSDNASQVGTVGSCLLHCEHVADESHLKLLTGMQTKGAQHLSPLDPTDGAASPPSSDQTPAHQVTTLWINGSQ